MNPGQRHRARHFAMQALYQWEITKELASVIEEQFLEDQPVDDKTDKEYLHQLIVGTITHIDEIDKTYKPYLNSRSIEDLDMVDKSILRLATYELLFQSADVPIALLLTKPSFWPRILPHRTATSLLTVFSIRLSRICS